MFAPATPHVPPARLRRIDIPAVALSELDEAAAHMRGVADVLELVADALPVQRRIVHAGDAVFQAGQPFSHLHLLNSGFVKMVNLSADGRDQIVSLKFRGDWLGFDGIADAVHDCDAIAMDTGEVWSIPYDTLLTACAARPRLMAALHSAMSRVIVGDRNSLMSVCTLPADARVADFLRTWAQSLARRGLRTDQIVMRMTRAEIGSYLGLTLETVSRALSRFTREGLIHFADKGRRDIRIPDVGALDGFVQQCLSPEPATLQ
jgi:CRP/FNR family transcriptional regulator